MPPAAGDAGRRCGLTYEQTGFGRFPAEWEVCYGPQEWRPGRPRRDEQRYWRFRDVTVRLIAYDWQYDPSFTPSIATPAGRASRSPWLLQLDAYPDPEAPLECNACPPRAGAPTA